jgi:acyl-CoA thioester hydrolase
MADTKPKMQSTISKRCLEIEMPIRVRTYDIDSAGHVSNIVYLRWMEDMRLQIFIAFIS